MVRMWVTIGPGSTCVASDTPGARRPSGIGTQGTTPAANGLTEVVLVSDPFHSARIIAMATELGLDIARVEDRVGLARVPGWRCGDFAPPPGAIVGHVERLGTLSDGQAVEYSRTWFDPGLARYVSRIGKAQR